MSKHEEFPELTQEAKAAWNAACIASNVSLSSYSHISTRRFFAAFLREAMKQSEKRYNLLSTSWDFLLSIADNLHSPPPPPTLAQAREADLHTPEGKSVVCAFLATLGEGGQP